jgi:hypothetical protein
MTSPIALDETDAAIARYFARKFADEAPRKSLEIAHHWQSKGKPDEADRWRRIAASLTVAEPVAA